MTKGTKPKTYYLDETGKHPVFGPEADEIKDTHIDWGTGADQVSAADVPIADAGGRITATEVEAALQEICGSGRTTETLKSLADLIAAIASVPPGTIHAYGGTSAPTGFLMCDGASKLRADYAALFAIIGTAFGTADGTHFNVPDLRGRFLRGQDEAQARDPDAATRTAMATGGNTGDNIGSVQLDKMQGHRHDPLSPATSFIGQGGTTMNAPGSSVICSAPATTGDPVTDTVNGTPRTGAETRPLNAYVRYIIKT